MLFRPLVALLLLAACSGTTDDGTDPDAGGMDAGGEADVGVEAPSAEIGTGQDEYQPLMDGQAVVLTQGPQAGGGRMGGYHIFSAVRVKGFIPQSALIEFTLFDSSGTMQAREERQLNMQPSGEFYVAYGFAPRIMDCCSVANQTAMMKVRVEDTGGTIGMDEVTVMPGACIERNSGLSQCP